MTPNWLSPKPFIIFRLYNLHLWSCYLFGHQNLSDGPNTGNRLRVIKIFFQQSLIISHGIKWPTSVSLIPQPQLELQGPSDFPSHSELQRLQIGLVKMTFTSSTPVALFSLAKFLSYSYWCRDKFCHLNIFYILSSFSYGRPTNFPFISKEIDYF